MVEQMPLFVRGNGIMKYIAQEESVVWILVVLLAFVTVAAFCLLWLKAGGTDNPICYLADALPSLGRKS